MKIQPPVQFNPYNILDRLILIDEQIHFKNHHINRTFESYQFLNSHFTKNDVQNVYNQIEKQFANSLSSNQSIRILFNKENVYHYQIEILELELLNSPTIIYQSPPTRRVLTPFKWQERSFWQNLTAGLEKSADVLLINENNLAVETSKFNLFLFNVEKNYVSTPTLKSGCLNGVFRRAALEKSAIALPEKGLFKLIEQDFTVNDIKQNSLYLANSIRGVLPAKLNS